MIPKEWRDYKWEFRPLVIAVWFVVSPALVLPLLWLYSIRWDWLDALVWDKGTAPAWVQAVGSVAAIFVAIAVPLYQRRLEVAELRAQELSRERLLALKLYRTTYDAYKFAQQAADGLKRNEVPSGQEGAIFESYLSSVTACFEAETSERRAKLASFVRGVLVVLVYDFKSTTPKELQSCLDRALQKLNDYRAQTKQALESLNVPSN